MIEYTVIYERGVTNWGAYIPDLPGCVSIGYTFLEVQENIKEAVALFRSATRRWATDTTALYTNWKSCSDGIEDYLHLPRYSLLRL